MPLCVHCGKELTCECGKPQLVGQTVVGCPKKKGALWAYVLDYEGNVVPGVPAAKGSDAAVDTDATGLVRFDPLDSGGYTVTLGALKSPASDRFELPEQASKPVKVFNGSISQVLFTLRLKPKVKVKLVTTNKRVLNVARVVLDGAKEVPTVNLSSIQTADLGAVPAGKHKIKVILDPQDALTYATTLGSLDDEMEIDLRAAEDRVIEVQVAPTFTSVRFVAYCLATVAEQVWQGNAQWKTNLIQQGLPDPYTQPVLLPDIADDWAYASEVAGGAWKVKYNGKPVDGEDIDARVAQLGEAIKAAAAKISDVEGQLKVFIAPECYFLNHYGAYDVETLGTLIQKLQNLVKDPKWSYWIFAFGTVNGTYTASDSTADEMFNISPVIKGGFGDDDASRYTRLIRKFRFSQEIPGSGDLILRGDEVRPPLTENRVRKNFSDTGNEGEVGNRVQEILVAIEKATAEATTGVAGWDAPKWDGIRTDANLFITANGMTTLVRDLRGNLPGGAPQWKKDLKTALASYLEKKGVDPTRRSTLMSAASDKNLSYEDACFSTKRAPGPWLDKVVISADTAVQKKKLTFALEICADHINARLKNSMTSAAPKPVIDIQLVPSAGAAITTTAVCATKGGYVLNCDGWNASGFCGGPRQNGARIFEVLNPNFPPSSGNNPLYPHSELWKTNASAPHTMIKGGDVTVHNLTQDISAIFSSQQSVAARAGQLHIYIRQTLPDYT